MLNRFLQTKEADRNYDTFKVSVSIQSPYSAVSGNVEQ